MYKKAGIILSGIIPTNHVQCDIFDNKNRKKSKAITTTIALVVISYVIFICVVAILSDFGLLNKDYILIYYQKTFKMHSSILQIAYRTYKDGQ